jgi:hypothetical protein
MHKASGYTKRGPNAGARMRARVESFERGLVVNSSKKEVPSGEVRVSSEGTEPPLEEGVPLSVRKARRMRRDW